MSIHGTELVMTAGMVGSVAWQAATGDTFVPALGGSLFANYLQHEMKDSGLELKDYIISGLMSFFTGIVAGPWVASQLPNGDGVIGVGALMASFVGVLVFTKFYDYVKNTDIFNKPKDD